MRSPLRSRRAPRGAALLICLAMVSCGGTELPARSTFERPPGDSPPVLDRPLRIGILVETDSLSIDLSPAVGETRPLLVLSSDREGVLGRFTGLTLRGAGHLIEVAPRGFPARRLADTLRIAAPVGAPVVVGGSAYRGTVEVFRGPTGALTVVNIVDLEDYLRGVVPLEIGTPGPEAFEAVKAQAVVARTYALSHLARWPDEGFDLYGDVRDQAYGGIGAERPHATEALQTTASVVATYRGTLIGAFYSACCGGNLAPAHETWDFPPAPYLQTRRDRLGRDDLCAASRHYRWRHGFDGDELMALITAHYREEFGGDTTPRPPLEALSIDSRYLSGRVYRMSFKAGGKNYEMGGDRVRWVLRRGGVGGAILRSSLFDIQVQSRAGVVARVELEGGGNGHGVGMCQAGALEMARRGYRYDQILAHYYPGTELRRLPGSLGARR